MPERDSRLVASAAVSRGLPRWGLITHKRQPEPSQSLAAFATTELMNESAEVVMIHVAEMSDAETVAGLRSLADGAAADRRFVSESGTGWSLKVPVARLGWHGGTMQPWGWSHCLSTGGCRTPIAPTRAGAMSATCSSRLRPAGRESGQRLLTRF